MIEVDGKYWSSNLGTTIHFGNGMLAQAGKWIGDSKKKRFLVVCGSSGVRLRFVQKLSESLAGIAESIVVYDQISKDPTDKNLRDILELIKSNDIDAIIGLGGGSSLDASKAASVIGPLGEQALTDVLRGKISSFSKKLFCVAIPTTAGTGAEISKGAIITWKEKQLKVGVRGAAVMPDLAIVDPELTLSVPMDQIKITGFDIFTHAVETYISKKCNPLVENYSLMAIRAVAKNLPLALKDPRRLDVRTQLSFYSMLMGYNLANSSTCLPHRLQYPLGVLTETEHAFGLASLYPAWMKVTESVSSSKFATISNILAEELGTADEGIHVSLKKFMENIELTPRLGKMGLGEADCVKLASMVEGALDNDPWWKAGQDLEQIYKMSL